MSLSVIVGTGSTNPFRTSNTSLFDIDKTTRFFELHSRWFSGLVPSNLGISLMVDVTTFPGSSMTASNALLVLTCAVVFVLALSSILSVDRLKRADLLAGLPFLFISARFCP